MLYALLIPIGLLILLLILHLRLRAEWSRQHRLVAVSIGRRTGVEIDFVDRATFIRFAGFTLSRRPFDRDTKEELPAKKARKKAKAAAKSARPKKRRSLRSIYERVRSLGPSILKAAWNFAKGILRAGVVEELEARIEAGFDQPDQTGMAYGYYQAMLGMVPAAAGRLVFVPDWSGASFAASGRLTVSLPLYRLVWRVIVLLWQLPSRKLLKMAIQREKGEQDVE